MKLHPWNKVLRDAKEHMDQGFKVFQQFNCGRCGRKQTMDDPNIFHMRGICQECGHKTDIVKDGYNCMATIGICGNTDAHANNE